MFRKGLSIGTETIIGSVSGNMKEIVGTIISVIENDTRSREGVSRKRNSAGLFHIEAQSVLQLKSVFLTIACM